MHQSNDRIDWLDGTKGILCLLIFVHHFLLIFFPAIHFGESVPSYLHGVDTYLSQSPLSVLFNGNYMVALFCVISAVVISRNIMCMQDKSKLANTVAKRYFRLMLPLIGIGFVTYLFSQFGLFSNVEVGALVKSPWAVAFYKEPISFSNFISSAFIRTWFYGDSTLATSFWMLSKLFIGTFVCILISAITWKYPKTAFIFYVFLIVVYSNRSNLTLAFVLGTLIAWGSVYLPKLFNRYVGIFALVIGVLLGGYPSGVEPTNFYKYINFLSFIDWHIIGAALTIYGLFSCQILQKLLSTRVFRWLGRISYSVYLIHIFILFSFSTAIYKLLINYMGYYFSVGISFVASLVMIVGLSFLYQRYVEKLCNKLQGKIFNLLK